MGTALSYFLTSAYSGVSGLYGAASATCRVNGQVVACPAWLNTFSNVSMIVIFGMAALMVVSMWVIFKKAGQPGWAAIVPIYSVIVLLKVVKKPLWWILLGFIPFVSLIIAIIVLHNLAKVFGKGGGFTLGLIFLPFIFYPILAFGKATYVTQTQSGFSANTPSAPPQPTQ